MAEYADRDIVEQHEYYLKHVAAMTEEGLHSKSDIAAELAHRDIEIDRLKGLLLYRSEQLESIQQVLGYEFSKGSVE